MDQFYLFESLQFCESTAMPWNCFCGRCVKAKVGNLFCDDVSAPMDIRFDKAWVVKFLCWDPISFNSPHAILAFEVCSFDSRQGESRSDTISRAKARAQGDWRKVRVLWSGARRSHCSRAARRRMSLLRSLRRGR